MPSVVLCVLPNQSAGPSLMIGAHHSSPHSPPFSSQSRPQRGGPGVAVASRDQAPHQNPRAVPRIGQGTGRGEAFGVRRCLWRPSRLAILHGCATATPCVGRTRTGEPSGFDAVVPPPLPCWRGGGACEAGAWSDGVRGEAEAGEHGAARRGHGVRAGQPEVPDRHVQRPHPPAQGGGGGEGGPLAVSRPVVS